MSYRDLFFALSDVEPAQAGEVLDGWIAENAGRAPVRGLQEWRDETRGQIPYLDAEELWTLYALTRVIQVLQYTFQPDAGLETWDAPSVTLQQYEGFMAALGFHDPQPPAFSPFFHEIVEVEQAEDDTAPVEILREFWPPHMLGDLMLSRGGVQVRAGRNFIDKAVAERSTLYWAYVRRNRPANDLSHGWGSNSQWRTSPRRDYRIDGVLHLNVDARGRSPGSEDETDRLSSEERRELLLHRCLVRSDKPHGDLWPYDDRLEIPDPFAAET